MGRNACGNRNACPSGQTADRRDAVLVVDGRDAVLVVDGTAIAKKGTHSVGVAAQYASALGKTANCQTLVSLTVARGEVPVMLALRLFLPESWTSKRARWSERAFQPSTERSTPGIFAAPHSTPVPIGLHNSTSMPLRFVTSATTDHGSPLLETFVDSDSL